MKWRDWIDADVALRAGLGEEVQRQLDAGVPLFDEFFGSSGFPEEAMEVFGPGVVLGAMTEWAVGDRRSRPGAPTVVEEWLADPGLEGVERALLEARRDAYVTIVLVVDVTPGEQLLLADVFSEAPIVVNDPVLSVDSLHAAVFPARLCPMGSARSGLDGVELDRVELDGVELDGVELDGLRGERLMFVAGPNFSPRELEQVRDEVEYREPLGIRHRSGHLGKCFERILSARG